MSIHLTKPAPIASQPTEEQGIFTERGLELGAVVKNRWIDALNESASACDVKIEITELSKSFLGAVTLRFEVTGNKADVEHFEDWYFEALEDFRNA